MVGEWYCFRFLTFGDLNGRQSYTSRTSVDETPLTCTTNYGKYLCTPLLWSNYRLLTSLQLRSPNEGLVARRPSDEQTSSLVITHPLRNREKLLPVRGNLLCKRPLTRTENSVTWLERAVGGDRRVFGDATCKLCTTNKWERWLVCRTWIRSRCKGITRAER